MRNTKTVPVRNLRTGRIAHIEAARAEKLISQKPGLEIIRPQQPKPLPVEAKPVATEETAESKPEPSGEKAKEEKKGRGRPAARPNGGIETEIEEIKVKDKL